MKLQVHDTYEKDEKITTDVEPTNNEDVLNKAYPDEKLIKMMGHISLLEKDYEEFKLQNNKQSVEGNLIQQAVKSTIQVLYDKALFDGFLNADKVSKVFFWLTQDVDLI